MRAAAASSAARRRFGGASSSSVVVIGRGGPSARTLPMLHRSFALPASTTTTTATTRMSADDATNPLAAPSSSSSSLVPFLLAPFSTRTPPPSSTRGGSSRRLRVTEPCLPTGRSSLTRVFEDDEEERRRRQRLLRRFAFARPDAPSRGGRRSFATTTSPSEEGKGVRSDADDDGGGGAVAGTEEESTNAPSTSTSASREMERRREIERLEDEASTAEDGKEVVIGYAELGDLVKAEELLLRAERPSTTSSEEGEGGGTAMVAAGVPLDVESHAAVLDAWLERQSTLLANEEKEEEAKERKGGDGERAPENRRSEIVRAARRAHALLERMEELSSSASSSDDGDAGNAPRLVSRQYDDVLRALSLACTVAGGGGGYESRGVPQIAQRFLEKMESLGVDPTSHVKPTIESYDLVLEAWSSSDEHGSASMAERVFRKLDEEEPAKGLGIRPSKRSYDAVIRAWSRSDTPAAAYEAARHFRKMRSLFLYGRLDMEPTLEDYRVLFEAWSRRRPSVASANNARSLLDSMERAHASGATNVKPDLICYRLVLETMAKSGGGGPNDMGVDADFILRKMQDERNVIPDQGCYDAAVKIWSDAASAAATSRSRSKKSTSPSSYDAARRAQELLEEMKLARSRSSVVDVTPTTENCNDVLRAWSSAAAASSSRSGRSDASSVRAAKNADRLLREMEERSASPMGDDEDAARPDRDSYDATIEAWAGSSSPDKAAAARSTLDRMIERFEEAAATTEGESASSSVVVAEPGVESFHSVLRACASLPLDDASDERKDEALRIAIETVRDTRRFFHDERRRRRRGRRAPTPTTYALLLKCFERLLPEGTTARTKAAETAFERCKKDGLVDGSVLEAYRSTVPFATYRRTVLLRRTAGIEGRTTTADDESVGGWTIPEGWRRNVVDDGAARAPRRHRTSSSPTTTSGPPLRDRKYQKILWGGTTGGRKF